MACTGTRTVSRPLRIGSQFGDCVAARRWLARSDFAAAAQFGQQIHELVALGHRGALLGELAHVGERGGEPRIVDRLQHVVDGACFEGLHRESVVRRHEDDHRQLMRLQLGEHVEARESGHLDVEEHEVRAMFANRLERLAAVAALADDFDVVRHAQAQLQAAPRQRFVVDQQSAEFARRVHGQGGCHFQRQTELDAQAGFVVERREPVAILVQHRQALADIAQTDAATRTRRRTGVETRAVVGHRELEHDAARASFDADRAALLGRRYRVFHRVFDQRLQQQARHQRLERAFLDGEFEPQSLAEPAASRS